MFLCVVYLFVCLNGKGFSSLWGQHQAERCHARPQAALNSIRVVATPSRALPRRRQARPRRRRRRRSWSCPTTVVSTTWACATHQTNSHGSTRRHMSVTPRSWTQVNSRSNFWIKPDPIDPGHQTLSLTWRASSEVGTTRYGPRRWVLTQLALERTSSVNAEVH